ncbi:MAG: hypothetical protein O7H41_17020 [Planctomycetota bacterium]|nr:hypothetical protein [Planctomycetota bacterium]
MPPCSQGRLILAAILALASGCSATRPSATDQFRVTVEVMPPETTAGLPVAALIIGENTGPKRLWVPKVPAISGATIRITVLTPSGEAISIEPVYPGFNPLLPNQVAPLEPGDARRVKEWISFSYGHPEPFLTEPGRYEVRAGMKGPAWKWVDAEPVTFIVRAPEGRDAEAAKAYAPLMGELEHAPDRFVNRKQGAVQIAEAIAREYGDTDYGKYSEYVRARSLGALGEHEGAASAMEHLVEEGPPANIALEARECLAYYHYRAGRLDEAERIAEEIEAEGPPHPIAYYLYRLEWWINKARKSRSDPPGSGSPSGADDGQ